MSFLDKLLGRSKDTAEKGVDAAGDVAEKTKDAAVDTFDKGKELGAEGIDKAENLVKGEDKTAVEEGDGATGQS
jgi:hypothetical protein